MKAIVRNKIKKTISPILIILVVLNLVIPVLPAENQAQTQNNLQTSSGEDNFSTNSENAGDCNSIETDDEQDLQGYSNDNGYPQDTENIQLLPGDILLLEYRLPYPGSYIYYWEHTQMYDKDGYIWEASHDGVERELLSTRFWDDPDTDNRAVVRLKNRDDVNINQVLLFCEEHDDCKFDFWSRLIARKQADGQKYYCSEIVWAAYLSAGVDLDPDNKAVSPWEFYDNPLTEVVWVQDPDAVQCFVQDLKDNPEKYPAIY